MAVLAQGGLRPGSLATLLHLMCRLLRQATSGLLPHFHPCRERGPQDPAKGSLVVTAKAEFSCAVINHFLWSSKRRVPQPRRGGQGWVVLHSAPCTLYPAPCTPHPAPCTPLQFCPAAPARWGQRPRARVTGGRVWKPGSGWHLRPTIVFIKSVRSSAQESTASWGVAGWARGPQGRGCCFVRKTL